MYDPLCRLIEIFSTLSLKAFGVLLLMTYRIIGIRELIPVHRVINKVARKESRRLSTDTLSLYCTINEAKYDSNEASALDLESFV